MEWWGWLLVVPLAMVAAGCFVIACVAVVGALLSDTDESLHSDGPSYQPPKATIDRIKKGEDK